MSILLNFHAGKKNSDKLVILIETERYTRPTHSRRCLDDRKYPRGYTKRVARFCSVARRKFSRVRRTLALARAFAYEIRATRMETTELEGEGWRR